MSSPAHGPSAARAPSQLPGFLRAPLAAMSESMLLPAVVAVFGIAAALFLVGGLPRRIPGPGLYDDEDDVTDWIPVYDGGYDDDEYSEYVVPRETDYYPMASMEADDETEQIVWRRPESVPEPIGLAHNGFHVDEDHFTALDGVRPAFVEVLAERRRAGDGGRRLSLWTVSESERAPKNRSRPRGTASGTQANRGARGTIATSPTTPKPTGGIRYGATDLPVNPRFPAAIARRCRTRVRTPRPQSNSTAALR